MSFPKKRRARQAADRAYEQAARVKRNDPTAERFAGGNVYSRADIEELERARTAFWRRRRR
jgi:hypothetical protein